MCHQHGNRHAFEDVTRGAAKDEFAQSRMAVTAHHQHVGSIVLDGREQRGTNIDARPDVLRRLTLDAVTGERRADIDAGQITGGLAVLLRIDPDDDHLGRLLEQWQGVEHGTGGFAATIPSHNNAFAEIVNLTRLR